MDYSNTDPMFGSAVFQEVMSTHPSSLHPHQSMGVMDFDSYSRPTMLEPNDIEMGVDSPRSESYCESDDATSMLGFQDSVTSPGMEDESKSSSPQAQFDSYLDDKFNADRNLVMDRWGPHDVFPADKSWSLEQKAAKLIELSPCRKYTINDLMNIDSFEKAEDRVDMLIEIVAGIKVNFRWNYVRPHELFKSYTVVTNCKKEKEKKDAEGNPIPKRPMNAFMIWCQKCRTLMAHICPQLHNAIISKALGAAWKKFSPEERAVYEEEKIKLMAFHQHEFPDYKYRPKKKPKKSDEKASPAAKPRSKKKVAATASSVERPQAATMLRGINIADEARQGLDPLLKERLQVKMQVKIDSDLKRGIGKRATAIDLADLTGFQAEFTAIPSASSSTSPDSGLYIDSHSSVFDTPENSPHEPRTPSDNGHDQSSVISGAFGTTYPSSDNTFTFDDKMSIRLQLDNMNNNSTTIINNNTTTNNNNAASPNHNIVDLPQSIAMETPLTVAMAIKTEPPSASASPELPVYWQEIKSEPIDQHMDQHMDQRMDQHMEHTLEHNIEYQAMWNNNNEVKLDVKQEQVRIHYGMPVLSVEYVDSVLEDDPYDPPDMNDLMSFITNIAPSDIPLLNESTSQFIIDNTPPAAAASV